MYYLNRAILVILALLSLFSCSEPYSCDIILTEDQLSIYRTVAKNYNTASHLPHRLKLDSGVIASDTLLSSLFQLSQLPVLMTKSDRMDGVSFALQRKTCFPMESHTQALIVDLTKKARTSHAEIEDGQWRINCYIELNEEFSIRSSTMFN